MKVYFSLHIWKEHVEIDHITKFHEKINWQSLLYRIPLRTPMIQKSHSDVCTLKNTHDSDIYTGFTVIH